MMIYDDYSRYITVVSSHSRHFPSMPQEGRDAHVATTHVPGREIAVGAKEHLNQLVSYEKKHQISGVPPWTSVELGGVG